MLCAIQSHSGLKSVPSETWSFHDDQGQRARRTGRMDGRPEIVNLYYRNSCIAPQFSPHRCQLRSGVRCHRVMSLLDKVCTVEKRGRCSGMHNFCALVHHQALRAAAGERIYKPKHTAFFTVAVPRSFVSSRISRPRANTR